MKLYSHWRDCKKAYTDAKNAYTKSAPLTKEAKENLTKWRDAVRDARNYLFHKKDKSDIEKTIRRQGHLNEEEAAIKKASP